MNETRPCISNSNSIKASTPPVSRSSSKVATFLAVFLLVAFALTPYVAYAATQAAVPTTGMVRDSISALFRTVGDIITGFRNLKEIALDKFFSPAVQPLAEYGASAPTERQPPPVAATEVARPLDSTALKSELKVELESYIRTRIDSLRSPVVVYSSRSPATAAADFESFRVNEVIPAIHYQITRQSDSDAERNSVNLSNITDGGTFTGAAITGSSFAGSVAGTSGSFETLTVSGAATSTFGGGVNLSTGCFAVSGTCIGATPGGPTTVAFADSPYTIAASALPIQTFLVSTAGGVVTINLPVAPSDGQIINIKRTTTEGQILTIGRNGKNIEGAAANFIDANTAFSFFTFQFDSDGGSWWIIGG